MMHYLLDTNVVSEVMRTTPNLAVVKQWEAHLSDIAVAATTWHELNYGVRRMVASRRRTQHEAFLADLADQLPILPYDRLAAEWHAAQRVRLTQIGKTPPFEDGQIAAVAAMNQLVLVTANTSDFQYFDDLQLENWTRV